jgi:hypothetical protein
VAPNLPDMQNGALPSLGHNLPRLDVRVNQSGGPTAPTTVSDFAERIARSVETIEHPSTRTKFIDFLKMIPKAARQGWNRKLIDR